MIKSSDNLSQKVSMALYTEDIDLLSKLMLDVSSRVRRAVARNNFTPSGILDVLVKDPVLNVSFMALQNKNCSNKRVIIKDIDHPCVCCKVKDDIMDCDSCVKLEEL